MSDITSAVSQKDTVSSSGTDAWYSYNGPESDVVLSTRVRLARNLANFPFPPNFRGDDADRIKTLVFDSFSHCAESDRYQALSVNNLDPLGASILSERGVLAMSPSDSAASQTGVVMRTDGRVACTVNDTDHVRISSFVPGLDGDAAYGLCRDVDDSLQKSVQFAASYDFGFLTASLADTGSGMKVSVRVHLPSVTFMGRIQEVFSALQAKGVVPSAVYGSGSEPGSSLGSYYQIATGGSENGSEFDQMAAIMSAAKYLVEIERKTRAECADNRTTEVLDTVYRAYAKAKFANIVPLRESIDTISSIKWGRDLGYITGIGDNDLCALLYRVQTGHLKFVLKNGTFTFEKDIAQNSDLQVERLRALILQEAFEKIQITERA